MIILAQAIAFLGCVFFFTFYTGWIAYMDEDSTDVFFWGSIISAIVTMTALTFADFILPT